MMEHQMAKLEFTGWQNVTALKDLSLPGILKVTVGTKKLILLNHFPHQKQQEEVRRVPQKYQRTVVN